MNILTPQNWQEYELLDSGNGQRLEKFGQYILVRPDPQCIWKPSLPESEWKKADAIFKKTSGEKGIWEKKTKLPEKWQMKYGELAFWVKLSPFKHTGVFPEQAVQWEWIKDQLSVFSSQLSDSSKSVVSQSVSETDQQKTDKPTAENRQPRTDNQINILNLFGYTGIASLAAAAAGAKVTHIDASYPTIGWARENQQLSGLDEKPIRWILDDAMKFCERELKRGVKYDGIIMDPPIYGHGPKGETWDFDKSFPKLMELCTKLLSDKPLFVIVNAYAISASAIMLENVLNDYLKDLGGNIESGELALQEKSDRLLSTGIFARWSK